MPAAVANHLTANVAALARVQPGFSAPPSEGDVHCVDGAWRIGRGDHATALHGRHADREADRMAADLVGTSNPDLLVVIGLGLGYLLDALDRRGWTGKVLALEPEPATVGPLLGRRDLLPWIAADRLRLFVGPEYAGAGDCGGWYGNGSVEPPLFVHPVIGRLRRDATAEAKAVAARIQFGARANDDARRTLGGRYLLNTLANLSALAREGDVATLAGAGRGMPAIVVAAGPSLDTNLAALRAAADRAFIIAVDTALRPLLAAGITPTFVVALDPSQANARHLCDLPACPSTCLVAEASLDPAAVDGFRGRTFLFSVSDHQPWPWLRAHGAGRGRLRAWGSVLTSAFDLALHLGCERIAFAGADLAFTGYRPYARGVVYEEDWRQLAAWGVSLEEQWRQQVDAWPLTEERDVHGAPARTAPQLVAFRNWLVEQIQREPPRRIVNTTGAGILHGGRLEQLPLERFIADCSLPDAPFAHRVRARYAPASGAALLEVAERLEQDDATLAAWEQFADGLSRERILATVNDALAGTAALEAPRPVVHPDARATVNFDAFWIEPLVASLPLTAMPIPPQRMDPHAKGVRRYRFHTTTARLFSCVVQLPEGAVAEDGRPMARAADMDRVGPGEYFIWRDQIYIGGADGTDPRDNRRAYTVLVPEAVAFAERQPLAEILAQGI